jgi:hypothetical protein
MNRSSDAAKESTFDDFVEVSSHLQEGSMHLDRDEVRAYPPKITLSPVTGKIRELRISKSLVRQLIYKGEPYPSCPYRTFHTLLLRDITTPSSEAMLKGMYFESACIGSSAGGEVITDLPRHKKTGVKLMDHQRIDQAIDLFHQVVQDYGLIIDPQYSQLYRRRLWIDPGNKSRIPVYLDGTLDFISPITTPRYSYDIANIDLKLTRDRETCDSFSTGLYHPTPWGCPERMDFTEAMLYRILFELPFVYLVFDFKKENSGFKWIPIVTDINDPDPGKANLALQRMNDLYLTLRWVTDAIFCWESQRWPMKPGILVCEKCPIPECPKRVVKLEI